MSYLSESRDTLVLCLQFCEAGCRLDERFVVVHIVSWFARQISGSVCWPWEYLHEAGTGFRNVSTNRAIKRQTERN